MIGATFGLLFVILNTAALPSAIDTTLRGLALAVFAAVIVAVLRPSHPALAVSVSFGPSVLRQIPVVVATPEQIQGLPDGRRGSYGSGAVGG